LETGRGASEVGCSRLPNNGHWCPAGWGTEPTITRPHPSAPALRISEESLLEKYPYDSGDLARKLRDRYTNYKQDRHYFKLKSPLESDEKYCKVRYLEPKNPKSGSKKFFSTEVFKVFDLHYKRKDTG
jgi:hypothetical protein